MFALSSHKRYMNQRTTHPDYSRVVNQNMVLRFETVSENFNIKLVVSVLSETLPGQVLLLKTL